MFLLLITFVFLVSTSSVLALSSPAVLVTGANKGIGKAIVKAIVQTKPEVHVFLGSRDLSRGEAAVKDIPSSRVSVLALDVGDLTSVEAAAKAVSESGFALTAICNNAGVGFGLGFEEVRESNLMCIIFSHISHPPTLASLVVAADSERKLLGNETGLRRLRSSSWALLKSREYC